MPLCCVMSVILLSAVKLGVFPLNVVGLCQFALSYGECTTSRRMNCLKRFHEKIFYLSCIGSDISIKSLKRKTKHQRRLQFNQRVKRAF